MKKSGRRYSRLEPGPTQSLRTLSFDNREIIFHPARFRPSLLLPVLEADEEEFFRLIQNGVVEDLDEYVKAFPDFNFNCQNYQGNTGLQLAVKSGNTEMVSYLLQYDVIIGDSILHAVQQGNCQIVKLLLDNQEKSVYDDTDDLYLESADFTADMTPLKMAAHMENFEMIKLLLDRGHVIEVPHKPTCYCRMCHERRRVESVDESQSRYHTYKALASPAYICQSSSDPILTAFKLSHELDRWANVEKAYRKQYSDLSHTIAEFAVDLLNQCRTSADVEMLLEKKEGYWERGSKPLRFSRLLLALDLEQKEFVANHSCQQVLYAAWVEGHDSWRQMRSKEKFFYIVFHILSLPIISLLYLFMPHARFLKSFRAPISKFISWTASYVFFLTILFIQNIKDTDDYMRGPPNTGLEWWIVIYIFGLMWTDFNQIWFHGCHKYLRQLWNWYDLIQRGVFLLTFCAWIWAYLDVLDNDQIDLERKFWYKYDPTLIAEGFFAVATILSFGRALFLLQLNHNMGPLQVSISRMFKDIIEFLIIFILIIISFATGLSKLYLYYKNQVRIDADGQVHKQPSSFISFPNTLKTLFWAIFGLSPTDSAQVIVGNLGGNASHPILNVHSYTETVGYTMFAVYHVIVIIVLINLLIAMMSNSFQKVQDNEDVEWKFARTRVWMLFFEEIGTLPPPFNLIPSPKNILKLMKWFYYRFQNDSSAECSVMRCCYFESDEEEEVEDGSYEVLIGQLVQRYLSKRAKEKDELPVNKNDVKMLQAEINELKSLNKQLLERLEIVEVSSESGQDSTLKPDSRDSLPGQK